MLSDMGELLFRQIHPDFIEDDGLPSSQPFRPTRKDENKLSVDRSSLTTAERSYLSYTAKKYSSKAVYGLTVGEFDEEKIVCEEDPSEDNRAHAFADYSDWPTGQQKKKAKRLRTKAIYRGKLYPLDGD